MTNSIDRPIVLRSVYRNLSINHLDLSIRTAISDLTLHKDIDEIAIKNTMQVLLHF